MTEKKVSRGFSHDSNCRDLKSVLDEGWGSDKAQKKKRIEQNSKVYFIREGVTGPIKIGISSNVTRRLTTLQTANSQQLYLMGVMPGGERIEALVHKRFEKFLKRGEWYLPYPELIKEIQEILERGCL